MKRPSDVYSIVKKLSANALLSYIQYSITQLSILSILHIFNKLSWNNLNQPYGFNPIQDGLFLGCSQMGGIFCTYPTMMKLGTIIPYLKKIQKIYFSLDTPFEFYWHQHFLTENQQLLIYQEIQIKIKTFFGSLKVVLINMVGILMSSKSVT